MQNEDADGNPAGDNLEEQDLEAIAEAVKTTLSQHPGLNTAGALQLKVEQNQGRPTQVNLFYLCIWNKDIYSFIKVYIL